MKELIIVSGKGGTGKTTLTSAFASMTRETVFADCDVDASNLPLILQPEVIETHPFFSGHIAQIRNEDCSDCRLCLEHCHFDAISRDPETQSYQVDPIACEGCGVCIALCRDKAIDFPETQCGHWYRSKTRFGLMIHAELGIGAENSGKLVATVRQEARKSAQEQNAKLILVDGPPGVGCPAIASITGADALLIVTEPTPSGLTDMERVLTLAKHFNVTAYLCINKWDLNPQLTHKIAETARAAKATIVGKIAYHQDATKAQLRQQSISELLNSPLKAQVEQIWNTLQQHLFSPQHESQ